MISPSVTIIHEEGTFKGYEDVELYIQCWRPEGEPKAILPIVHGHGEHSGRYGNVVNWFVPRGYAVYAFDLRGHGHSAGPQGHINEWAEYREDTGAFLRFVQSREPSRPIFLIGHSLGGLITLEYVLRNPKGLAGVIVSGPVLAQVGISPVLIALARALSHVLPRLTLRTGLDVTALSRDPAVVEAYVSDPLVHSWGTPRLGSEVTRATEWVQAHTAEMEIPCLILHGSADRLAPPEGSRAFYENMTLADKELHVLEDTYHEVLNDVGHEQVMTAVEGWLDRHCRDLG
jgi:alpha-beta hydrolase superfamily lysophospholipase